MGDDLDGFFDDIEQLEEEVGGKVEEEAVASGKEVLSAHLVKKASPKVEKRASSSTDAADAAAAAARVDVKYNKSNAPSVKRKGGGKSWTDDTLKEYPPNSWLLFVGNLGNDVHEKHLAAVFKEKYRSFAMARVVRFKPNPNDPADVPKSKGFGFVCFTDPLEMARALREMNGKICRSRPMMLKKSTGAARDAKKRKRR